MAKKSPTPKTKPRSAAARPKPKGRPPLPIGQLKTERVSLRVHPDLYAQIGARALEEGLPLSAFVERVLIARINCDRAKTLVDWTGRLMPPDQRRDINPLDPLSHRLSGLHYLTRTTRFDPEPQ